MSDNEDVHHMQTYGGIPVSHPEQPHSNHISSLIPPVCWDCCNVDNHRGANQILSISTPKYQISKYYTYYVTFLNSKTYYPCV